jgi:hypothetical protein
MGDAERAAEERLVDEIRRGRCIAFLGAGFSAPVCRSWPRLLEAIATEVKDATVREQVATLVARGGGHDYEVAAQILEDAFAGDETARLLDVVRAHTRKKDCSDDDRETMAMRTRLLAGIPFSAILTTNFDDVLDGRVLDAETYGDLLRETDRRWVEKRFWRRSERVDVLKLHGDLAGERGITLSRRGYRKRLYAEPGYLNVLRSVFLTKTLLFLGFSFSDGYLNELRSEALAYVGKNAATPTLAYAVIPDLPDAVRAHYAKHEGIHVFSFASDGPRGYGFLDDFLEGLHRQTNPAKVMGPRLENRRILWVDPSEQNNARGVAYLREASRGLCTIDLEPSHSSAIARAKSGNYDLVITRWGHHPKRPADAVVLLEGLRREDVRTPVVVFASGAHAVENREAALRLGALEYTSDWETLFEVIDRRFGPPP